MWLPKNQGDKKLGNGLVAVAVDKDKNSQNALKWAIDNILQRGQTVILIHVKLKSSTHHHHSSTSSVSSYNHNHNHNHNHKFGGEENPTVHREPDAHTKEMLLPFRCFCTRKDIQCKDVMLEDVDVAKALIEYVSLTSIENLVLGASSKNAFLRFKATDIPGSVGKGAPDFCSVYVIAKGKIQSMRSALRPAPSNSLLRMEFEKQPSIKSDSSDSIVSPTPSTSMRGFEKPHEGRTKSYDELDYIRSPFTRKNNVNGKSYPELPMPDSDISYVSLRRPSTDHAYHHHAHNDRPDYPRVSSSMEFEFTSFESSHHGWKSDISTTSDFSSFSHDSSSSSTHGNDDVEAEMKRLKLELKQTMEMYSTACKEALTAKQNAVELQRWKREEEKKLEEARMSEEAALAMAEMERAKSKAAIEAAEAAKKIADLESHKRVNAEKKAHRELEERRRAMDSMAKTDVRYRRYSIEEIEAATFNFQESRKIGEGGYGPVYKCYLDHTPVAIKVLRPDAAQGRSQFQQEVEVLSCIRHPNMVLLLGACPEYGCLVYEFMANGSLEDRLFRRGNTPALSWQLRFRIAAEIGTGLLFLHQSKPKPLVHRDLKPGNILLDRNFVSKISDVGLARLVPPSSDAVTQYRMTSTAGTFCYIDPEYQQTGMLGTKSDVYSLGILFLQLITARPAMGLAHHVEKALERGTLPQILDPAVSDWPIEDTLIFAKMALKCAELRRKDRPDLCTVILPELNRLRSLAEESMASAYENGSFSPNSGHSQVSLEDSLYSGSTASSRNVSTTLTS